ncbi:MAG: PD-(D/E)XK nuclease family protein [Elusimicrobia bacterium]|nr:PD-(D/E)XK nuclease family protein [Elusimicrobiota bacterium]
MCSQDCVLDCLLDCPGDDVFEISYTKVRTYLNCPWLYKLKFIDDWKAPPSPRASLGLSLHKSLELCLRRGIAAEESILAALDEVWDRSGYADAGQELDYYDQAKVILRRYIAEMSPLWPGKIKEIEKSFELESPDSGLKLIGIIDRIDQMPDGSFAVIEYKSHISAWSEERLRRDLQMTIYAHAARQALGLAQARFFYFFLSLGKIVEAFRTDDDWRSAEQTLKDAAAAVQSGRFEPDSRYCPSCEMNRSCSWALTSRV